jgi:hypothetical protein
MPQQFSNNARSTLTSTITDSATSLTIQTAAADLFPVANVGSGSIPSANDWFKATLQDVSGNVEIIYVRTRTVTSPVFSDILRGQEGTTARSFTAGSVVGLRVTAADIQATIGILTNNNQFTGANEFIQPLTLGGGYSLGVDAGKLVVKHNNVTVFSVNSTGGVVATGTLLSSGTP